MTKIESLPVLIFGLFKMYMNGRNKRRSHLFGFKLWIETLVQEIIGITSLCLYHNRNFGKCNMEFCINCSIFLLLKRRFWSLCSFSVLTLSKSCDMLIVLGWLWGRPVFRQTYQLFSSQFGNFHM